VTRIDPGTNGTKTIGVGKRPEGIAVGAGFVWVANNGDGTVSKIDPRTNQVVDSIHVGRFPIALTVGGGAVWVVNSGDRTVTRVGI
jgi:YVTN family beta-propeller protein